MAEEKYRRERSDRASMPTFARVMMVLSVVQIVFGMLMYIGNPEVIERTLLFMVSMPALAGAVLAVFMWPSSRAFRSVVRIVIFGVPLAVIAFGIYCAIAETVQNPDSLASENWLLYGALSAQFTQVVLVFGLPVFVAAASYGARIDRVLLSVAAWINAVCEGFIVFYVVREMGILDLTLDHPVVNVVYVAFAVVFATMTFVPAIGNDPDHTICKKA